MPRLTSIYTRAGDEGRTQLGGGQVVSKHSLRIEALGDLDELNAILGTALSMEAPASLADPLRRVQNDLFDLGAETCFEPADADAARIPQLEQRHVDWLESAIDQATPRLGTLNNFILPGGSPCAASLHLARTVCRRAERNLVRVHQQDGGRAVCLRYLNRLSDALFQWARIANLEAGTAETLWRPGGETEDRQRT